MRPALQCLAMQMDPRILKLVRERSGYSGARFASKIGINQGHYSNIENGTRGCSPETAKKIADGLKVEIVDILRREVDSSAA